MTYSVVVINNDIVVVVVDAVAAVARRQNIKMVLMKEKTEQERETKALSARLKLFIKIVLNNSNIILLWLPSSLLIIK